MQGVWGARERLCDIVKGENGGMGHNSGEGDQRIDGIGSWGAGVRESANSGRENSVEPGMAVPAILGEVAVDALDGALVAVRKRAAADGGKDNGFGEGGEHSMIAADDCFGKETS